MTNSQLNSPYRLIDDGINDDDNIVHSPIMKVNEACQVFGLKGDEGLAHNLQGKEFEHKYNWNREVRRTARTDVPLAKATYDEEEERLQRERMEFLQNQSKLADDDAELARQYQKEEMMHRERERMKQEMIDQEFAKRMQEAEENHTRDRESGDRLQSSHGAASGGYDDDAFAAQYNSHSRPTGSNVIHMSSFGGFNIPGEDYSLSEEQRKQLMMLQDEELAMALQEHEQMKAVRCHRYQIRTVSLDDGRGYPVYPVYPPQQYDAMELYRMQQLQAQAQAQAQARAFRLPENASRGPPSHDQLRLPRSPIEQGQPRLQPPPQQQQQPSPGPPIRQAPRPPLVRALSEAERDNLQNNIYEMPREEQDIRNPNERSVTMVTSVGQSEFFSSVPAAGSPVTPAPREHVGSPVTPAPREHVPLPRSVSKNSGGGGIGRSAAGAQRQSSKLDRRQSEGGKKTNNCKQQ